MCLTLYCRGPFYGEINKDYCSNHAKPFYDDDDDDDFAQRRVSREVFR